MGTNIFISFRFSDGVNLKKELKEHLKQFTEVFDRSEDVDRSHMSEDTIRTHLYKKLRDTSVTIVLLTPQAVNHRKNNFGNYDDWMYDELRYSLENREHNRTNGVVAVYTDETRDKIFRSKSHICEVCKIEKKAKIILDFDNLIRKNVLNVKDEKKSNPCEGLYDEVADSYISFVHLDDFKKNPSSYINKAKEKRERKEDFELKKKLE